MESIVLLLAQTLVTFFNIYFALLIIRILLTWFPNVDWTMPPLAILSQLTDPYLNIFRNIIPPIGGIDFSAILAILLLQVIQSIVPSLLVSLV
ncbi:MAG: YggT family protein [Phormidium sp. BM_Day4_Bin.17]|nr:YggT family protein [Phormidium sp. BM_Day4_Bin.17]UCJ12678.1 MAG: YggT family protein [Phormidium sp. PBR-2020]